MLFNLVMDDEIKEARTRISKLFVGYKKLEPVWLGMCTFEDDLVVFAESNREFQKSLDVWNKRLLERKLE